jgi:hypothetical protein
MLADAKQMKSVVNLTLLQALKRLVTTLCEGA